ncbi:MAG: DNA mismatch repair endonuclease MutL [Anaerolineae bacterium]|nr:DNA mismatch repair endonuclease MutL [Anaerolineae bacterium]HXK41858.1 DNA mismatch repair endonuclease MutL [Anaerolineae bacterium]
MPIQLLPEDVAARIAAGEVVERPASVVKELVENSLDAGATRIEVETLEGGHKLLRVSDNGEGIPAAEVTLAFRRHATSKLSSAEELFNILTLGFRGEALASIASVSQLTCSTHHREELTGTQLRIAGGEIIAQHAIGRPPGTEMRVEELFYNVPARRKFLQSPRTERRHIDAFLTRYAVAYPCVAFTVLHDGQEVLRTTGNGAQREALQQVYGPDLGDSLLEIAPEWSADGALHVYGYVGPTTVHRSNRGYITLFVNGRWIEDMRLTYAVIQAYHTLLPVNRYPVAFLLLEIPTEDVDVNVHPAKTEVRFRDPDAVFRAVQRAVRATVIREAPVTAAWQPPATSAAPVPDGEIPSSPEREVTQNALWADLAQLRPAPQFTPLERRSPDTTEAAAPTSYRHSDRTPEDPAAAKLPPLRVIGQAVTTFIVAEGPDGLYLIDQHAAHERVLYEQLLSAWAEGAVPSQPLLEPVNVTLPAEDAARLEERLSTLAELGLTVEPFGPNSFLVRAVPALLAQAAPGDLLADIAAAELDHSPVRESLEAQVMRRICKRAAIKAGQILSREEMETLIYQLEQCRNPRTCPHGRPTILQISVEQLASQFERT